MKTVGSLTHQNGSIQACSLDELGIGCQGQVVEVNGDHRVRRRLLEMGFCNGASITVIRRAPLGDPIEFELRGYHLSLRSDQARYVRVVQISKPPNDID